MSVKICVCILLVTFVVAQKNEKINLDEAEEVSIVWSQQDLFFYGMLAGTFVSLIGFIAAFLLLCFRKLISQKIYTVVIQVLFAFSCGALLGETMLHILPEAYASRHLKDQNVSLTFIAAIFFFIFLERLMNAMGVAHTHWHQQKSVVTQNSKITQKRELQSKKGSQLKLPKIEEKESTGFLNLFSSLLHNFIDGLAIGIAFNLGNPKEFLPVTIGIIAHEIPREMGDVAILLKSRFNEKQTIISNGVVNLISLVGVYMGLNANDLSPKTKQYALVFVAGNFLYIASDIWKNLFHHHKILLNILQMVGLLSGIYITLHSDHHH